MPGPEDTHPRSNPFQFTSCLTAPEARSLSSYGPDSGPRTAWRDGFVCRFLLATGLRRSELTNASPGDLISWNDVTWLTVIGKGNRSRSIPIPCALLIELSNLQQSFRAGDTIFIPAESISGVHRLSYCGVWRAVARASVRTIGRRIHPHTLRHTAATLMLATGASLLGVQAILGHRSIRTTEIYLHHIPSAMVDSISPKFTEAIGILPSRQPPRRFHLVT